jgi:hypothetical protein
MGSATISPVFSVERQTKGRVTHSLTQSATRRKPAIADSFCQLHQISCTRVEARKDSGRQPFLPDHELIYTFAYE